MSPPAPKKSAAGGTAAPLATVAPAATASTLKYATAGLKRTKDGWVTVVARFEGFECTSLETYGPPETLKEYATTRLMRRMRTL